MQAEVLLLDKNVARLREVDRIYQGHMQTVTSNSFEVERAVIDADLVIGAVLVPGAKAPTLVSDDLVAAMKPGAVLVDISVDQGGCFESTRPTTHSDPVFEVNGCLFYCVANMPGAVPNTSTVRAHERDAAVRGRDRQPRAAGGGRRRSGPGPRGEHREREARVRPGRRGARPAGVGPVRGAGLSPPAPAPARAEPAVGRAVEAYLDHLAVERGLATNTLSSYRRDLDRYTAHLRGAGRDRLSEVAEADVTAFLVALRTGDDEHQPLSAASAGRAVVAVRGLHRFAVREGWSATDPAGEVRPPVPVRRLPKAITVAQVEALLAAPDEATPLGLRDRALLELLYATGARISEAVGLDVDELDRAAGLVRLDGKGGKQRVVPVRQLRGQGGRGLPRARPARARGPRQRVAGAAAQRPRWAPVAAERLDGAALGRVAGRARGRGLAAHAAALVRHPPARRRRRRPRRAGAARARVGDDDAGLHARHRRAAARGVGVDAPARPRRMTRARPRRAVAVTR
jgi:integrase/recombinase XerD